MLAIVQQYKKLFTALMVNNFATAENLGTLPEEVEKGTVQARNKELLRKFLKENEGLFSDNKITEEEIGDKTTGRGRLLAALQTIATKKPEKDTRSLVEYFTAVLKLGEVTVGEIAELKADMFVSKIDTSAITSMEKGSDNKKGVAQLQQFLVALGLLSISDVGSNIGIYGDKTSAAVKLLQEKYNSAKPTKGEKSVTLRVTGSVDDDTIRAIGDIKSEGVEGLVRQIKVKKAPVIESERPVRRTRTAVVGDGLSDDGREVVADLREIQRYLRAYNKTYGEKGNILSNKMGILGILNQVVRESDSEALARELGISNQHLEAFASELGITTGANIMPGVTRFAIIAALSLILTGGAGVAGEIFGINIGTKLHRGPNVDRILQLLGRQGNFNEKYRKMLLSKKTTIKDIEAVFDVLNDEEMIPANLRRESEIIFDRNFLSPLFDGIFGIFGHGENYRKMERLIDLFNRSSSVEEGEFYLKEVYKLGLIELRKAKRSYSSAYKDLEYKREHGGGDNFNDTWQLEQRVSGDAKTIRDLEASLAGIGNEVTRISTLRALKERKAGFTDAMWRQRVAGETADIEQELGGIGRPLKTIPQDKLVSKGAYSLKIPSSQEGLLGAYKTMRGSKIEGDRVSVLANVMRSIKAHYGIEFSEAEFKNAFLNMRRVSRNERLADFGNKVVSNTSRNNMQKFQGGFKRGELVELNINGTKVYLKDNCTNVITIINDLPVTIESRTSVPFILGVYIGGLTGAGNGSGVGTNPGWTDGGVDLGGLPGGNFPL